MVITKRQFLRIGLGLWACQLFCPRVFATPPEFPLVEIATDHARKLTLTIRDRQKNLTALRLVYASFTEKGKNQVLLKQETTSLAADKHAFSFVMDAPASPGTFAFEAGLGNLDLSAQFEYHAGPKVQSKAGKWIPLD